MKAKKSSGYLAWAAAKKYYRFFLEMHPNPYFRFENIPASGRLEYELLSESNYMHILNMFQYDLSPYIVDYYQDANKLKIFAESEIYYHRNSPKYGGCDWLIKLKSTDEYIGVLNLYNLSIAGLLDTTRYCSIGYNLKESARRKGYATEAVNSLTGYIFLNIPAIRTILIGIERYNQAGKLFAKSIGFKYSRLPYFKNPGQVQYELRRKVNLV